MPLSRNLPLVSARSFFAMFLVIMPVIVPYWRSLGFSMREVLELQALFGFAVAAFEVPTGYIADLFGRKVSVVLGSFISGVTFSFWPFTHSYWGFAAIEVSLALGCSLVSGADDALMYESIPPNVARKKVIGAFNMWGLLAEVCASLLAGALIAYSFAAVTWAQAIVGWLPFCISLFLIEPPRAPLSEGSHYARIGEVFRHILLNDPLTRLIFMNFVVWGLSSFCVVWLLQQYWVEAGVSLSWFGVMWAGLMLVSVFTSRFAHAIEARLGADRTLLLIAAAPIAGYLLMAFAPAMVGIVAGSLFYVTRGLTYVVYQDAFNWRVPSSFRATANSIQSLFFRLGFVPIGPLLGFVADTRGLTTCLATLAGVFGVIAITLLLPLVYRIDEMHVDYIPER